MVSATLHLALNIYLFLLEFNDCMSSVLHCINYMILKSCFEFGVISCSLFLMHKYRSAITMVLVCSILDKLSIENGVALQMNRDSIQLDTRYSILRSIEYRSFVLHIYLPILCDQWYVFDLRSPNLENSMATNENWLSHVVLLFCLKFETFNYMFIYCIMNIFTS